MTYDKALEIVQASVIRPVATSLGTFTIVDLNIPRRGYVVLTVHPPTGEVYTVAAHGETASTTGSARTSGRNAIEAAASYLADWL